MKTVILIIGAIFLVALLLMFLFGCLFAYLLDREDDADGEFNYDNPYLSECGRSATRAQYPDEDRNALIRDMEEPKGA